MRYIEILTKMRFDMAILCLVIVACLAYCNCYATATTEMIELKCNNKIHCSELNCRIYAGDKKIKYSLATTGMKTPESGEELIKEWDHEQ